ncbi:hypothetical protein HaLaN_24432 [Haematococcus lacustris]|uniref:Uncharacterized protein n=1 Tax=Haematococcus lacustris TaxID=44745 RepID=A0A699ZUC7_HAELA|nr:hypothetical protein HaLaN_24432 [Haematococcus lacustris]
MTRSSLVCVRRGAALCVRGHRVTARLDKAQRCARGPSSLLSEFLPGDLSARLAGPGGGGDGEAPCTQNWWHGHLDLASLNRIRWGTAVCFPQLFMPVMRCASVRVHIKLT